MVKRGEVWLIKKLGTLSAPTQQKMLHTPQELFAV